MMNLIDKKELVYVYLLNGNEHEKGTNSRNVIIDFCLAYCSVLNLFSIHEN